MMVSWQFRKTSDASEPYSVSFLVACQNGVRIQHISG